MFLKKIAFTAAGFAAGVVVTLTSLTGTASPVGADQAENAYMLAQKGQVSATTYQLDMVGLHKIWDDSQVGTITAGALGNVRRSRIAIQATEWPHALEPMAKEQVEAMKALEEAIRTEDAAKVVAPSEKAHNHGHDLSATVYTWLDTGKAPEAGQGH